ncbi:ABC transporter permease [Carnobacterium sp. FSL W8-0810]|uniref:ABC transporter permease n=1 Tax=Carnobacterium sp. FSL W8-0810 TaxID=2954705 RepID=UPI0030F9ABB8
MKKYIFYRIIRSIISIFLVTTIGYIMIFSLVPRYTIFQSDPVYSRLKGSPDERVDYENSTYKRMGYIDYYKSSDIISEIAKDDDEYAALMNEENSQVFEEWQEKNKSKGWKLGQMPISKTYYAVREIPILQRVGRFYSKLIQIDHPWAVQDPENPDLPRYLKFEYTESAGLTLTGSGTRSKYLIYFDSSFPFIHQNFVKLNLGTSYPTYSGRSVTDVISSGQGKVKPEEVTYETGLTEKSPADLHSRKYKTPSSLDRLETERYNDSYVKSEDNYQDPSMIKISMITGLISVVISYTIGISLAVLMARHKGKLIDRFGVGLVTILISVPSLAFIYFFRFIGSTFFGLPDSFPTLGAASIQSYILPTVILGLLSISGLIIWIRRFMIDQASADYVKFAKAKGLSEKEISQKHIFKNAMIPIVSGIPGTIILTIQGATITETIFAVPGMGKMLPDAIIAHNNPMVIGLLFVFTTLSILAVLLGDIMLTIIDPRISLLSKKGGH